MLGTITKNDQKFDPIPDNVYLAKLVKVEEKAPPKSHPEWYPSLSWRFQILVDPFKGRLAFGKTPTNWLSGKKLDNWLITCGINVASGTSLRIEDLKDIPVKILVKGKKYNDKQTGEEKVFSEVTDLLALDSLDQIKIRELVAGTNMVANVSSQPVVPQQPTIAPSNPVFAGGYVPVTTTAPAPSFPTQPTAVPTFTPAPNVTGTPSRTIPF
jgi:hypothetical protein